MGKVKVIKKKGRPHLVLRWLDPATGQERQKTAETANRREAERRAGEIEADMRTGRYDATERIGWEDFRVRFEDEHLPSVATSTQHAYVGALNAYEAQHRPKWLAEVSATTLSQFQTRYRKTGVAEATIANRLRHLKAALRWAVAMGYLAEVPAIKMPRRARGSKLMKGRPITEAEFERMLNAVEPVVGQDDAEAWRFYLRGLWWSGLRVSESLQLFWDRSDRLRIELDGQCSKLHIAAEWEKGNKDRICPIAPEFVRLLEQVAESDRRGHTFGIANPGERTQRGNENRVKKVVSQIGQEAEVQVAGEGGGRKKYASSHDLRRSFGVRWAQRLTSLELKELMRHESVSTTERYYVGQNADRLGETLWKRYAS